MPLVVNIRHLELKPVVLQGELPVEELDLNGVDDLIHVALPLTYKLEAELMGRSILVQGRLHLPLECDCVRCLTRFEDAVDLPHWACHLPLEGEEQVAVVNDCVDLTPWVREDTLLAFPQHPLCKPDCSELPQAPPSRPRQSSGASQTGRVPSAWAVLDQLKLEKE